MARNRRLFEPLVREDFDEYLEKITNPKEWVGEVEMNALSLKYKINFEVYYDISKPPLKIKTPFSTQTIRLACSVGNRYDCVYSKTELSALAFCQAVVYEVLYKKVYDLGSDVDIAVEKMLHDKAYSKQRRTNVLSQLFKDNCRIDGISENHNLPEDDQASLKNPRLEIRKALAQGVPPFPYKVAKTLDPGIYRNVEFDMWNEKRKDDQKNEQFIIPKLEPGVKCKVHINKEIYVGHVQDIYNDSDDVSIYIEELCKRCVVSSSILEIVPVPAYKALTWQGGKTYKVYSDNVQAVPDTERSKYKKGFKKSYQEHSQINNSNVNTNLKTNSIVRSNSLPSNSSTTNSSIMKSSSFHSSPQFVRKKGHLTSTPMTNKKIHSQREARSGQHVRSSPNFSGVWDGMDRNVQTSPIPIPGKVNSDCYRILPESPETLNELTDSGWVDESAKHSSYSFPPPPPFALAPIYSDDTAYSSISASSFTCSGAVSNATSLPLPIPGSEANSPTADEVPPSSVQPNQCPAAMAVYSYPVYTVPSMYLVCRDGSTLPVNIGAWGSQDAISGNEVAAGVPSVYFNTPPTGMSPPVPQWIQGPVPNYSSAWPPSIPSAVAFTPPLEMNAYQSLMSPPWSPQSGIYVPPPPRVAYQVPPMQPCMLPQEPAQN